MQQISSLLPGFLRGLSLQSRSLTAVLLILMQGGTIHAQDPLPRTRLVRLQRGRVLELLLSTPVDSGTAQSGDEIQLKLAQPLRVAGSTVLPKDWMVRARITRVTRAGRNCNPGRSVWKLQTATAPDGRRIKLQTIPYYIARRDGILQDSVSLDTLRKKIGSVAKITALVPVLVVISPFIVLMAIAVGTSGEGKCGGKVGSEESIPAGTVFYAAVSHETTVTAY
jgi:hypothetical protein